MAERAFNYQMYFNWKMRRLVGLKAIIVVDILTPRDQMSDG